ncbi:uncharacterized protein BKA55DRAFT_599197 [Fusarium redolens]|uniref:Peptidase M20 domain-containing protein 2 n=1 Tax=Fusarium redolens TaxID=48865 RepID=A0A9P9G1J9_FUSRE|nr:uncharacterized protein BKA55DRAFT_599197 [Fusarium redolens]KAH7227180.1 hypothetical protein BKA55DRAFT_599197 [Fusarium redolens]
MLQIHDNPELGWHEKHAHRDLTEFLEKQGFNVTRGAYNLPTAFIAEYSHGKDRSVSFNAEYDALPGMGHACGHNLIATAFGTPAEEIGGGKAKLIQAGAYDDLDCSLMTRPGPRNYMFYAEYPALMTARLNWTGVPAHVAESPWNGLNALDGFVSAYVMTGLLRQQLELDTGIQQVLSESSNPELDYWDAKLNSVLTRAYLKNQMEFFDPANTKDGKQFLYKNVEEEIINPKRVSPTDQGNASHKLPSIHIMFPITNNVSNQEAEFANASGTELAHRQTIKAGKLLP